MTEQVEQQEQEVEQVVEEQVQQQPQPRPYRVSVEAVITSTDPVNAAIGLLANIGKPGVDKFNVVGEDGQHKVVDVGLLRDIGVIQDAPPQQ